MAASTTAGATPPRKRTRSTAKQQEDQNKKTLAELRGEELLKPVEVAKIFRVDPKTVSRWAGDGRIKSLLTPGGHRRFRAADVRALLQKGTP